VCLHNGDVEPQTYDVMPHMPDAKCEVSGLVVHWEEGVVAKWYEVYCSKRPQ
jgi:hypothetical protein